ncbi:MAG: ABC transporter substrate-binding protein, partial [Bradyrhizobium sp.]|nr:ABC transporter substrate-binding protein [Bradyrhizobium sp.]
MALSRPAWGVNPHVRGGEGRCNLDRLPEKHEMGSPNPDRRTLLAALFAAAISPGAFAASTDRMRLVGCLSPWQTPPPLAKTMAAVGFVEGENLRFELRSHMGSDARALGDIARELVATRPDALVAYAPNHISALLAATRTIPIVCGSIPDPVAAGFAQSLRHPGGNVTGLSTGSHEIWPIVIGMLRTLRPRLKRILVVHSPEMPVEIQLRSYREAAGAVGLEWSHAPVSTVAQADAALLPLAGEAVHLAPITSEEIQKHVLEAAHHHRIMTFGGRDALMSYSRHFTDELQRVAAILAQVLRGADPGAIP